MAYYIYNSSTPKGLNMKRLIKVHTSRDSKLNEPGEVFAVHQSPSMDFILMRRHRCLTQLW